jgi:hypothetical protein
MQPRHRSLVVRSATTLAVLFCLTACQSLPPEDDWTPTADAVSIFITEQDATAVATGHPGAVPRMIVRESDLIVIGRRTCDAGAVQVKAPDGSTGWSVAASLKSAGSCPLPGSTG